MAPLKMRFSVASQRRDGAVATYQQTPPALEAIAKPLLLVPFYERGSRGARPLWISAVHKKNRDSCSLCQNPQPACFPGMHAWRSALALDHSDDRKKAIFTYRTLTKALRQRLKNYVPRSIPQLPLGL